MDPPSMYPGPAVPELLFLQGGHRSSHIWDGQLLSQTFHPRHINDLWEFIRDHPLHPRTVTCLQRTGFYRIIEIGWLQFDWPLITAMIERLRPKTQIFHLPIDEATITLPDVEVQFGLPVDGMIVNYPQALRDYQRTSSQQTQHVESTSCHVSMASDKSIIFHTNIIAWIH
ncbi:serine/threonine-protein phosphatase 7 long form homolog [Nicotiana tomentosiformis]|uniref:serine/threonine-protein phosphatase 7 long form homolog n=1 Tax=Nicotiana tomentosiformis TaxID=4098 RepID=UPI00388C549F